MVIGTYKINLISFHKRNLNLALLTFILSLKDFSPMLYCNIFNYSYGVTKKHLYTLLKAPHIHKKAKDSVALFKYKSTIKIDISIKIDGNLNHSNYFINVEFAPKSNFIFELPLISEYIKFLIKTSKIIPYVATQFDKELRF